MGEEPKPLSPATIQKYGMALRSVLNYAGSKRRKLRCEGTNTDAARLADRESYIIVTVKTPSTEEVQAGVKATECAEYPKLPDNTVSPWWRAYRLLACTGVRKGDLLGVIPLKWRKQGEIR